MNEKIKQISEDYVNGLIEIITKAINEKVDEIGPVNILDEAEIRVIAADEARDAINDASISIDV